MIGQLYSLSPSSDNLANAKPAQFVHRNNDDDFVRGFIVGVDEERLVICLWEPAELPEEATVLAESLTQEAMFELFEAALEKNPAARQHWHEAISNSPTAIKH